MILLRFVDEMSLQEIAAALAIPIGTVKSRLHLALKQLRELPESRSCNLHEPFRPVARFTGEERAMAPEDERFEDLPQSLIEGFKAADQPVPVITARVDRAKSQLARAHFAARRSALTRRSAWAAIAATVLIAVFVLQLRLPTPEQDPVYADVDRSGRIDIADVLALARAQEPGERSQAELDAFAYRIVSLEPAGEAS